MLILALLCIAQFSWSFLFQPRVLLKSTTRLYVERETGMSAAETTLMDVVCWSNSSAATEEADRIWAETLQSGLDPSPKMYEMMILIFLSNDDADLAIKESEGFLNEMLKLGALPSQTVVIALIELYGSLGAPKRAEALIDRLTFAGMTISVQVYNTLMRAWGASSPMEAEEVFKRLQFANVQPDQETFMALIDGWSSSPRSDAPARCNDNVHLDSDLTCNDRELAGHAVRRAVLGAVLPRG